MKHAIEKFFTVCCVLLLLMACQGEVPTDSEANKLAERFVVAVNEGKYDEAFGLVEDDFFGARPKEKWAAYYDAIKQEMGPVVSVKLTQHLTDNRLSGRFYMYQFSIKHENGFTKEMVTMIQKINNNDPLRIIGHKIESSKLMKINELF